MAYDWSGNDVKQQRYDRVIVAALVAVASIAVTAPFMLRLEGPPTGQTMVKTAAPVAIAAPPLTRLART